MNARQAIAATERISTAEEIRCSVEVGLIAPSTPSFFRNWKRVSERKGDFMAKRLLAFCNEGKCQVTVLSFFYVFPVRHSGSAGYRRKNLLLHVEDLRSILPPAAATDSLPGALSLGTPARESPSRQALLAP